MREHLGLQHVVRVLSFCPFGLGKLKAVGSGAAPAIDYIDCLAEEKDSRKGLLS